MQAVNFLQRASQFNRQVAFCNPLTKTFNSHERLKDTKPIDSPAFERFLLDENIRLIAIAEIIAGNCTICYQPTSLPCYHEHIAEPNKNRYALTLFISRGKLRWEDGASSGNTFQKISRQHLELLEKRLKSDWGDEITYSYKI